MRCRAAAVLRGTKAFKWALKLESGYWDSASRQFPIGVGTGALLHFEVL